MTQPEIHPEDMVQIYDLMPNGRTMSIILQQAMIWYAESSPENRERLAQACGNYMERPDRAEHA